MEFPRIPTLIYLWRPHLSPHIDFLRLEQDRLVGQLLEYKYKLFSYSLHCSRSTEHTLGTGGAAEHCFYMPLQQLLLSSIDLIRSDWINGSVINPVTRTPQNVADEKQNHEELCPSCVYGPT